jgi:hypothetical protein
MTTLAPKEGGKCTDEIRPLLSQDIWVNNILPLVGPGHFAFVVGVSKDMKQYYLSYLETVEDPPRSRLGWMKTVM